MSEDLLDLGSYVKLHITARDKNHFGSSTRPSGFYGFDCKTGTGFRKTDLATSALGLSPPDR